MQIWLIGAQEVTKILNKEAQCAAEREGFNDPVLKLKDMDIIMRALQIDVVPQNSDEYKISLKIDRNICVEVLSKKEIPSLSKMATAGTTGACVGAGIGSVVLPGVGTAIGFAVGTGIGALTARVYAKDKVNAPKITITTEDAFRHLSNCIARDKFVAASFNYSDKFYTINTAGM